MRSTFFHCLLISMLVVSIGCTGSSSPVVPGQPEDSGQHSATIEAALEGVDIQNTDLESIKLNGTELLPWGFLDVILEGEDKYPIEVRLADPDGDISLSVTGAVLLVDGAAIENYNGRADAGFIISDVEERIEIHFEIIGEYVQTRDITVRTKPTEDWPTIANLGVIEYTDPETGLVFDIAERELLIGAQPGTSVETVEAVVHVLGCEILRAIPYIDAYRIRIPADESYERYIRLFESSAVINYAEFNSILYPCIIPNDTYEDYEYGNGLMQCYDAWDITTGTADTIIAIVDTGVMRDHPDLAANVIDGEDFMDPPGDGLGGATPGDGLDNNNDGVPDQNVEHGTHCAGIAGSVGNNNEGASGISWHTKILSCRIFPIDGDSGALESDAADAIIWAADQGATGISMSFGGPYGSSTEQNAINYAWGKGSVLIGAAGNSNYSGSHYPSDYSRVISVAATTSTDKKASFSNYSSNVDCSAPGVTIVSSIFYEHTGDPYSVPENERYALFSGTSMACPQVAGLVALVGSYFPSYTNSEIRDQVVYTADNIDDINPTYAGKLGSGRINAYKALTMPLEPDFEVVQLWTDDDHPLYSQGNRDGFLNPGEIIEFTPSIKNIGTKTASDTFLTLVESGGYIEPLYSELYLGYVYQGETVTPDDPLIFRVSPDITDDTELDIILHFEYYDGDPIEILYPLTIRTDLGVVDTIACSGEDLLGDDVGKGMMDFAALAFTIEGDLNYGTLDELTIHQTGTAPGSSFTDIQLWLDADENGYYSPDHDTRIAYQSYDHPGYRGSFDDINDSESGLETGADYEEFPAIFFNEEGIAHFYECVLPTAPGVPRTVFIVLGILPTAVTGDTVQIGILSADDVILYAPDQVNPLDFPITTDEVPIVGRWLDPQQLTNTNPAPDNRYSWRAETAVCPVTGYVYVVLDSNRNSDFDVFCMRSTDHGESFEDVVLLDTSSVNEFYPDVQVDVSGMVHVVYYSTKISSSNREIYYTRSLDNGVTFDTPVRLTNATRDSRIPKLAIGPGGSLNVTWHDDRTAYNDYNIYFMRSDDGGDSWGAAVMVCDTSTASEEAAIAVGGDGVIHITWEQLTNWYSGNVYYSCSTDNGLTFSPPVKLSSGSYNNHCWHSDVAADNIGNVYVVYHYVPLTIAAEIGCSVSNNSGVSWNTNFKMTDNYIPDSRPAVHCTADGSYVDVVFRRLEAETWNIYHAMSEDGLATWTEPVQISLSAGGDAREPVVVRSLDLNIFSFWEDVVNAKGDYDIFYNRFLF